MKILFVSLGCDKNLVDSEHMLGLLRNKGYEFTDDEYEAEVIVVNTCCFIGDAKEESINTLIEMGARKEDGKCKVLIACGCLAQRYAKEIRNDIPEVDVIVGTTAIEKIVEAIDNFKDKKNYMEDIDYLSAANAPRIVSTGGHYSYLKIAEGCDKHCSYCIIPRVRGNFRSVPMEYLLEEAKKLAESGVKELILVAQETTMYGTDLYGEKSLHKLLKKLCEIESLVWIRVLYCYPEEIYDELLEVMASENKICKYIDIPIQHASDRILKRMGRRTTNKDLRNVVLKLREKVPGIVIRTTLISGFPGETQEDHEEVMRFVDEMEFDRLGVFTYSQEEDTPAASFPDQIDEDIKEERKYEIMELQSEIVEDKVNELIGKEFLAIIEGKIPDENAYMARTYMDIPGVDSNVFVMTDEQLMTGDFVKTKITGALEYDLIGELVL
ncbi:MAG: 30S ribosomal protein S12 methylthiotransferase RimO [Lachnospiraceae bacterium]|nr:30S ribosomal protein S12 methylthiotransferase RimO [Lachnospiraceae bacterium]